MPNKVVVVDYGIIVHKAIFAWPNNKAVPPTYTGLSMMIGWLYRLDLDPDDIIIVAVDARNSWRKDYQDAYKGDRQAKREALDIPFEKFYGDFNYLADTLNKGMNFHFITAPRCEADDVMAVACRFYKELPVVLLTSDADLEQCWEYPNVRIFSTQTKKWKIRPENFDLKRLQATKIYKETTDNMVSPILNEEDYEKRRLCVNLITLPEKIENSILAELQKIGPKNYDVETIPFKGLRLRMANLYNDKSKILSYEAQVAKEELKETRKKNKKKEVKDKIKRDKEKSEAKILKQAEKEQKLLARIKKLEEKNKEKVNA